MLIQIDIPADAVAPIIRLAIIKGFKRDQPAHAVDRAPTPRGRALLPAEVNRALQRLVNLIFTPHLCTLL